MVHLIGRCNRSGSASQQNRGRTEHRRRRRAPLEPVSAETPGVQQ
jgi:hypothetical protein